MKAKLTDSRLANLGASAIFEAFRAYQKQFNTITQRACGRFEDRDWRGLQADATERLSLYRKIIKRNVGDIRELLGNRVSEKLVWASIKAVYSNLIADARKQRRRYPALLEEAPARKAPSSLEG